MIRRGVTVMLHDGTVADLIGPNNGDGWLTKVHATLPHLRRLQRDEISMVLVKRLANANVWRKP